MTPPRGRLGPHTVNRVGFGAMQIPGPGVTGPPRDHDEAVAVVRRARERGVDHIDTASYYGPDVANRVLREALDPWPAELRIVSKVGVWRDAEGGWRPALEPDQVRAAIGRDLEVLGLDRLTAVNLRVMDTPDAVFLGALEALIALRDEGAIELIGLSNVGERHLDLAAAHTDVACVQNRYGLLDRDGEGILEITRERGLAFVPFFPLGSAFGAAPRPTEHPEVRRIAADLGATAAQVALAWLLRHADNILLIPGTSSLAHLEENLGAGELSLADEHMAALDGLASR